MPAFAVVVFCTLLHGPDGCGSALAHAASTAQAARAVHLPALTIDAAQRVAVRAAAAPYRGAAVRIVLHRATPAYASFARGLGAALEAAGWTVAVETVDSYDEPDCPQRPGLRIMYGIARSGAVNAIAEALIRSRVVTESISGCSVPREHEFTFILSGVMS
jgi:hypothetical protein